MPNDKVYKSWCNSKELGKIVCVGMMVAISKFTLLSCFCIHFLIVTYDNNWIANVLSNHIPIFWSLFQGISFLLYPLCGWLADIYVTQFRMIASSFILVIASSVIMVMGAVFMIIHPRIFENIEYTGIFIVGLYIMINLVALGMYESNAIQFGMDQMFEASSEQLSSFIHWYYWCAHVGPALIYYGVLGSMIYSRNCVIDRKYGAVTIEGMGYLLYFIVLVQIVSAVIGLFTSLCLQHNLFINKKHKNQLKLILQVLRYSYKHKYPVKRSALTYWEDDIPSRIDLGKEKYGGPFTVEEVEDVKAFLRLTLLMVSLFGFQLAGDGTSLTGYLMNTIGCPPIWPMATIYSNTTNISLVIILLGIPLYQWVIKKHFEFYVPSLLNRIGIGLFLCFIAQVCHPLISTYIRLSGDLSPFDCHNVYYMEAQPPINFVCIASNIKVVNNNGSCSHFCPDLPRVSALFMLPIIPLLCYGLSSLLVFMTVLEFTCAQAPKSMIGLLIGIWYSLVSFKSIVVNNLDQYNHLLRDTNSWNIYHCVKGFFMFLSVLIYWFICKHYQYRKRNEIVNEQAIIEDQYERELLLNESENSSSDEGSDQPGWKWECQDLQA